MLTVVKVSVAQGDVYARYLEGRTARSAAGDYYLRDGGRAEARGRWVLGGLGAEELSGVPRALREAWSSRHRQVGARGAGRGRQLRTPKHVTWWPRR